YGINLEDNLSHGPKIKGLILREKSNHPSNFRCELDLDGYLKYNGVAGIEGIDTRALTKVIRAEGSLRGLMTDRQLPTSKLKEKLEEYDNRDAVNQVSTKDIYTIEGSGKHLGIVDFGIREDILNYFKGKDL